MKIKILQWNIWYKEKSKNVINFLKKVDADIFCLQEITKKETSAEQIIKALGLQGSFCYLDTSHGVQGNGIFTRFDIVKQKEILIKKASKKIETFFDEARVLVDSEIKIKDKKINIATTHMSYSPGFRISEAKEKEANRLLNFLKNKKNNFIFTGDLNAVPTASYVKMLRRQFKNLGPNLQEKTWDTKYFSYNGFYGGRLNWRLDYVFGTYDVKVISARILKTKYSDHLPILIEIDL